MQLLESSIFVLAVGIYFFYHCSSLRSRVQTSLLSHCH